MPRLTPLVDGDILLWRTTAGVKGDFVMMVERADDFLEWIKETFEEEPQVFLTGPTNFRNAVATITKYKGNRKSEKPRYFYALREYLVNFKGARASVDCECDDVIASLANDHTAIVSNDKDFLTVGNTYVFNPVKNELRFVTEEEATFNFYVQTLVGDVADNIKGIDGIGKVKAPKLLEGKTKDEMEQTVLDLYCEQYGQDEGQRALTEIKTLLHLRRDIKL